MALWRQFTQREQFPSGTEKSKESLWPLGPTIQTEERSGNKESLIAPNLIIEGKIEGTGPLCIFGRFKGEVHVRGDLTVEQGAQISGEIRAENIVVRGEVKGNIHATARVELSESGVLTGDLKASSLTVAAGSRMRGKVEFGWDEREADKVVSIEGVASGL